MADVDGRGEPGVIFDVDGTLLDTNFLHAVAWARAFRRNGHDVPMATLHRGIGLTSGVLVEHVLGRPDEQTAEAHSEEYEPFKEEVRAFPRTADLIKELRRRGLRIVLATSGKPDDLEWMLPAIGVDEDTLDGALTSGDVDESKPSPDPFRTALEKYGLDPERSVVVGDTVWDVQAAARAGLKCVAVTCGGIDEHTLRDAGAVEVHDDPAALLDALDESVIGLR
jgi:HAD superfamily hydrolase (TIGR01509 family)